MVAGWEGGGVGGGGGKPGAALRARGIRLGRALLARREDELRALFGDYWRELTARARGEDDSAVATEDEDAKSYSQQETFGEDIGDLGEIERIAKGMIDDLMPKIRADGKRVRTLTVKVRYPGMENESTSRSLDQATDLEAPFYPLVRPLLKLAWRRRSPLRLVSVKLSGVESGATQLEMFAQADEKKRRLAAVLDKLNAPGGKAVVKHGHQLGGGGVRGREWGKKGMGE